MALLRFQGKAGGPDGLQNRFKPFKVSFKCASARDVTWFLLRHIILRHVAPRELLSNRGHVFLSEVHKNTCGHRHKKLAFEAEIRFRDTVEVVEAKLSKMQEILDQGSLMGLEEFLRPNKVVLQFLLRSSPACW
ncbi:uncharacterized protein LOC142578514 [Dermacentor variabilis]|uniref:uncharacterized protein LOC142578514 n=1 Tax=Dermacentor variabilis TaxID=34621 RepID=UPI003F5C7123